MDTITRLMLTAGWTGLLGGVLSGAVIGLFFHREGWMGGYGSFRRRMTRLGHISFFGLGFVNLLFAVTHELAGLASPSSGLAAAGLIIGAATMPTCCFLTAWKAGFRHLFAIPVGAVTLGVVVTLSSLASGFGR
jgi:hypothetical protein